MLQPSSAVGCTGCSNPVRSGITSRTGLMPGVQLWYSANKGTLTLGLTTPATQRLIPAGVVPEGASVETSATGWAMYRWVVPVMSLEVPPEEQPGANELLERIVAAFAWFSSNRIDRQP